MHQRRRQDFLSGLILCQSTRPFRHLRRASGSQLLVLNRLQICRNTALLHRNRNHIQTTHQSPKSPRLNLRQRHLTQQKPESHPINKNPLLRHMEGIQASFCSARTALSAIGARVRIPDARPHIQATPASSHNARMESSAHGPSAQRRQLRRHPRYAQTTTERAAAAGRATKRIVCLIPRRMSTVPSISHPLYKRRQGRTRRLSSWTRNMGIMKASVAECTTHKQRPNF